MREEEGKGRQWGRWGAGEWQWKNNSKGSKEVGFNQINGWVTGKDKECRAEEREGLCGQRHIGGTRDKGLGFRL